MTAFPGLRRRSTLFALAAMLAARRARAEDGIVDALGRHIALKAPAQRIVVGFNYEEFTAVSGPAGWDRVVEPAASGQCDLCRIAISPRWSSRRAVRPCCRSPIGTPVLPAIIRT